MHLSNLSIVNMSKKTRFYNQPSLNNDNNRNNSSSSSSISIDHIAKYGKVWLRTINFVLLNN